MAEHDHFIYAGGKEALLPSRRIFLYLYIKN